MLLQTLLLLAGLVLLLTAGELLVRGAVDLARALNVPALIVSLTIVAFGTSAPEMVVSAQAVMNGNGGIALGNIIGSNVANILMVLGIPALVYPISAHVPGLRPHAFVMAAATLLFAYAAYILGGISQFFGIMLFAGLLGYLILMLIQAKRSPTGNPVVDDVDEFTDGNGLNFLTILFLVLGLVGLPLGAHLLVTNGAAVASAFGVRDAIIGLTVIAFGTSLPELATVMSAALKKKSDVAIGSIVGSNIFNLLAVGGITGVVGGARFDSASLTLDIPIMLIATAILVIFTLMKKDIGRVTGAVMTILYITFIAILSGAFV